MQTSASEYGHTCRACHDLFRSAQARDSFCESCRSIIEYRHERLKKLVMDSGDLREAWEKIGPELACDQCFWKSPGRKRPPETKEDLLCSLYNWAMAAHCHFLRHVFFNRFPFSRRFFPPLPQKQKEDYYRFFYDLKWRRKMERFCERIFGTAA